MTEFILNSKEHKTNNNTLTFNFKKPIRFTNSNISFTSIIFYNYVPNINENYKIYVNYGCEAPIDSLGEGETTLDWACPPQ